jgi:AraC family transcriptional regulator
MDGIDDDTPSAPGTICLIPQGVPVHLAWRNHAPVQTSVMIEFDRTLFETYAPEILTGRLAAGHLVPSNYAARPGLAQVTRLLADEIDPDRRRGRLFADTAIRLLALEIAATAWSTTERAAAGRVSRDRRIAAAIDFIEAHFARDISLIEIAAAAHLGPAQLTRLFRQATGLSPYRYVIARRLRAAVRLLRTTDLPIAIVALEAGFGDQAHLTRAMRARLGCTPGSVRGREGGPEAAPPGQLMR